MEGGESLTTLLRLSLERTRAVAAKGRLARSGCPRLPLMRPVGCAAPTYPRQHVPGRMSYFGKCGGSDECAPPEALALSPDVFLEQDGAQLLEPCRRLASPAVRSRRRSGGWGTAPCRRTRSRHRKCCSIINGKANGLVRLLEASGSSPDLLLQQHCAQLLEADGRVVERADDRLSFGDVERQDFTLRPQASSSLSANWSSSTRRASSRTDSSRTGTPARCIAKRPTLPRTYVRSNQPLGTWRDRLPALGVDLLHEIVEGARDRVVAIPVDRSDTPATQL